MIVSEELFVTHLEARETDLRIAGTPSTVSGRVHGARCMLISHSPYVRIYAWRKLRNATQCLGAEF